MKRISIFILAVISGTALLAQTQPKLVTPMAIKTRFGVKGGVNLAEYRAKDYTTSSPGTQMKTSFVAGAFVNVPLSANFRLQPEVLYNGYGSKLSSTQAYPTGGSTYTLNWEEKLHYISVPVLLQLQTSGGFFVETGPQLGVLLNAKANYNTASGSAGSGTTDIKSSRRKTDFSWAGGLGYLTRIGLGIDARYVYGITNIFNDENATNTNKGKLRNTGIQVSLLYQFGANQ